MVKNIRYRATQINSELFLKFPKFLINNKKYEKLSNDARVAYMLIKDRYRCSLVNQWIDAHGDAYVFFTIKQLKELLHVGKNKAISVKKELIDLDLLEIEKQGYDRKLEKNLPDKLYLLQPEYNAEDLTSKEAQDLDMTGSLKSKPRSKNEELLLKQENNNYEKVQKHSSSLDTHGSFQTKPYKDNNSDTIKDTKHDTGSWDFSSNNYPKAVVAKQNNDLLNHLDEYLNTNTGMPMFLNRDSLKLIKMWFRSPEQVSECISTILNAANSSRKTAIEQTGTHELYFEDDHSALKRKITNTLRRYFNKMRNAKKGEIHNPKNYLYVTMNNLFDQWQNDIFQDKKISKKLIA